MIARQMELGAYIYIYIVTIILLQTISIKMLHKKKLKRMIRNKGKMEKKAEEKKKGSKVKYLGGGIMEEVK